MRACALCTACLLGLIAVVVSAAQLSSRHNSGGAAGSVTTVVGPPEVVAGPTCCLFDSPFLAVRVNGTTVTYSANSGTFVMGIGQSIDDLLPSPAFTGLGADKDDDDSLSHCGKWLNAAYVDGAGVVHGFFHQEW